MSGFKWLAGEEERGAVFFSSAAFLKARGRKELALVFFFFLLSVVPSLSLSLFSFFPLPQLFFPAQRPSSFSFSLRLLIRMLNTHAINIKKSPPQKKKTEPPRPATDAAPSASATWSNVLAASARWPGDLDSWPAVVSGGVETTFDNLHEMFRKSVQVHGESPCLGSREVLADGEVRESFGFFFHFFSFFRGGVVVGEAGDEEVGCTARERRGEKTNEKSRSHHHPSLFSLSLSRILNYPPFSPRKHK